MAAPTPDGALEWRVAPSIEQKRKRNIVVVAAFAAAMLGGLVVSPVAGFVGALALVFSTAEVFLGVSYRLDEHRATSRCGLSVSSIEWSAVKRILPVEGGMRLSPLDKSSRLDEFRGVFLRFSDNEDAIWGKIRQFWHGDTSALDRGTDRTGDQRSAGEPERTDPQEKA